MVSTTSQTNACCRAELLPFLEEQIVASRKPVPGTMHGSVFPRKLAQQTDAGTPKRQFSDGSRAD